MKSQVRNLKPERRPWSVGSAQRGGEAFGLRQSSGAFHFGRAQWKSARGLAQSKSFAPTLLTLPMLHARYTRRPSFCCSAFCFLLLALAAGCSKQAAPPAASEKAAAPESRVKHGTNGETIITLDAATQKLMGLQTTALEAATLPPQAKGYGRVLDPSPLASLAADIATAQSANAASQAELKRLKTLATQQNASERAVQAAEAAATRDQTQIETARLKLLAGWGPALAGRQDLTGLVQALGSQSNALVEVDLPAGQSLATNPTSARLLPLASDSKPTEARFLGPAPAVDPQLQAKGYLFLVEANDAHLAPGATVTAFLNLPGEPQAGVIVPRAAVIRFNGAAWLYLQTSETTFQRVELALDPVLADGWFVRSGLKPADKIVTTGAQELLSEELKGQVE